MSTPEDLVMNQYAKLRQNLGIQQKQNRQQMNQGLDRQFAVTGLDSGSALKARSKAEHDLNESNLAASNALAAQEGAANLDIAKQKEAEQFQSGEASKQRQEQQFEYLGNLQFQKDSFASSLALQNREFDANTATNLFNAAIAAYNAKDFLTKGAGSFANWRNTLSGFGLNANMGSPVTFNTALPTPPGANSPAVFTQTRQRMPL